MTVRRVLSAAIAVMLAGSLTACVQSTSGLPGPISDNSQHKADIQMRHIVDAVRSHDAEALRQLFSARARQKAVDLDKGVDYFLSVFPSGELTWKSVTTNSAYDFKSSKTTERLAASYKVFADGQSYSLQFIDFPVNQVDDPKNVGLYALGVAPYTTNPYTASGARKPFYVWLHSFASDDDLAAGTPGIYTPPN